MRCCIAAVAILWSSAAASGQEYSFTPVAGPFNHFIMVGDGPSINDAGFIAFEAALDTFGTAILRASPTGQITTIATTAAGPFVSFDPRPSIDRLGNAVVFGGNLATGEGVYVGDGGALTPLADPSDFATIAGSPAAQPGADGAAVFVGVDPQDGAGMYRGDGGRPVLLAGFSHGFTTFGNNPGVNASGTIAFRADLTGIGQGIFLRLGETTIPLAIMSARFTQLAGSVAIDSHNRAAFRATLAGGVQAIILADASGWAAFADTSGPFATFNVPAINDFGEVVFRATTDSGEAGIFNGRDPVASRIIGTGDAFHGSTITSLDLHSLAINARGQIAFRVVLADGRQEIVRGDPPPCPADIVLDRMVNVDDLIAVILGWGRCTTPFPPRCTADIVPDCVVNVDDLIAVILQWGGCP